MTGADGLRLIRIVAAPSQATDDLARSLRRSRAHVVVDWPPPDPLPSSGEVLFHAYDPALAARVPWTPGEAPVALVVLIEAGAPLDIKGLTLCAPDAVMPHPASTEIALATLSVAHNRHLYERRLRARIDKLDETLRANRAVERAKAILVAERRMSEADAYALLRQRAMEKRVTIGAIAAAFVDSHQMLK